MKTIKAARLQENAVLPTRKHPDDAGIDFYAAEEKVIPPHAMDVVGTGITVEIPQGYVGLMMPKSRNDHLLGAGVIDAGYQGEIRIKITLMAEWLRISFSDNGAEYFIDKRRDTSTCARNILRAVSDFHTDYMEGKPVYCMDFLYEKELDIQEFLLKSMEAADNGYDF